MVGKAIGIGGVFFRSRNPEALGLWYETHLGVSGFWEQQAGMTVFAPFSATLFWEASFSTSSTIAPGAPACFSRDGMEPPLLIAFWGW